jgi:hypothetical protein
MVTTKDGVDFAVVAPAGFVILAALKTLSAEEGVDLVITSACDGVHSGPGDPHHSGEAYDVRSHDFALDRKAHLVAALSAALGPRFFAFLESAGTANEHIHAQRARGTTFAVADFLAL